MAQPFFATCIILKTSMRGAGATHIGDALVVRSMIFYRVLVLWAMPHFMEPTLTAVWIVLSAGSGDAGGDFLAAAFPREMAGCAGMKAHHRRVIRHLLTLLTLMLAPALAEPLAIRVVAANLTSDSQQSYSPDNANHSNPEGAGARILKALKPDVVLIQEFNTGIPARQWVNKPSGADSIFPARRENRFPTG
jgi:hypothetical protein